MSEVTVLKRNLAGEATVVYDGTILERQANRVVVEAFFNKNDMRFMGIWMKKNDRFVETYYSDRWYNIFEIYDRDDGHFKGWYCNVTKPAVIKDGVISYVDLALDLWVDVDGKQTVLDEDEFAELDLDEETRQRAFQGLEELKEQFNEQLRPR